MSVLNIIIAVLVPTLVAVIAAFPLLRASKADRDAKLLGSLVDLLTIANARVERTPRVGAVEQGAAIAAVAEMGKRHPNPLYRPALWGLRTMDETSTAEEKANILLALPEALQSLEDFEPRRWLRWWRQLDAGGNGGGETGGRGPSPDGH
jgi:hypothetical protein